MQNDGGTSPAELPESAIRFLTVSFTWRSRSGQPSIDISTSLSMPAHGLGSLSSLRHRRGAWLVASVLVLLVVGLTLDYTVSLPPALFVT
jgi:hypothetical protein